MARLLEFFEVTKRFKRQEGFRSHVVLALDRVSFNIDEGEFVGLIGHNGAGKSTSIKLLMGFLEPTEGSVLIRGENPNARGVRKSLGYVPENASFSDFLTGTELMHAFGYMSGLTAGEARSRSASLLEDLGIAHAADRLVKTYSKGMAQRLALAQALLSRPDILILDEPMTGLDPVGRRLVLDVLLKEVGRGVSLLFCSHLMSDIEQLCHRVLWLNRGAVHYDGPIHTLLHDRGQYELIYRGATAVAGAVPLGKEVFRVEIEPAQLAETLSVVSAAGGRVESYQPASRALEEIFVEASKS